MNQQTNPEHARTIPETVPMGVPQGIKLPCPKCGKLDATVKLWLDDQLMECNDCEEEFRAADVRDLMDRMIERWTSTLRWLNDMPRSED